MFSSKGSNRSIDKATKNLITIWKLEIWFDYLIIYMYSSSYTILKRDDSMNLLESINYRIFYFAII